MTRESEKAVLYAQMDTCPECERCKRVSSPRSIFEGIRDACLDAEDDTEHERLQIFNAEFDEWNALSEQKREKRIKWSLR